MSHETTFKSSYRFDVNITTASRHFHTVLNIIYAKTKWLIHWPEREALRMTLPTCFQKFFKKCAVIINCTEIFVEHPSNLMARAQLWSNYKHHCNVKVLIGIIPQGTISYLSRCAGGRISDKEIVEISLFVNNLLPGLIFQLTSRVKTECVSRGVIARNESV